jgi:hypothetical protein
MALFQELIAQCCPDPGDAGAGQFNIMNEIETSIRHLAKLPVLAPAINLRVL